MFEVRERNLPYFNNKPIYFGDELLIDDSVYFIEPDLTTKRRGVANARLGRTIELTEDQIKDRLLEIRKGAVAGTQKNLTKFKKNVKEKGLYNVHIAKSPSQVANIISKQNQKFGLSRIDMNRSNTLRALTPELTKTGFEVIHTYNYAIKSGSVGIYDLTEPEQYWSLDELEFDAKFQSFNRNQKPITYSRELITKATDHQDFIGLVGANVFSASGEILEVQHLYNISSILNHAKQSFIVLTLDKLVGNYQDALYQSRCTAMFGLEQILLDLFDIERLRGTVEGKSDVYGKIKGKNKSKDMRLIQNKSNNKRKSWKSKNEYFDQYQPPEDLHIIILDDARSKFIGTKSEDLLYCIGCRRCGLHCPRVRVGKQKPITVKDLSMVSFTLTARELIMDGYLYGLEKVLDEGLFDCSLCRSCSNICPVGIDLAEYLLKLREDCQKKDLFAEPHKRIRKNIQDTGTAYGSDYVMKRDSKSSGKPRGRD
jgi:L-lactate utilization protein LutB